MEQKQVIIIDPEQQKKPLGMQIAALVFGIIGLALSYFAYWGTFAGNIAAAALSSSSSHAQGSGVATAVVVALDLLIALFCLAGMILGILGLIKSIRRATRTVKGIVFSSIGLSLSETGFVLMIVGMVFSGALRLLLDSGLIQ